MTAIQICALLSLIFGAMLFYWVGYRSGLIDDRAEGYQPPASNGPTAGRTSEESGITIEQNATETSTALVRNARMVDAKETNSLCCAAAGITKPLSATAKTLIPHEKLREAARPDAPLNAKKRPPAQPAEGYKSHLPTESPTQLQVIVSREPV